MATARHLRAHRATLLLWILLPVVLLAWHVAASTPSGAVALSLLTVGPLLLPLRGLWRADRRSHRWAPLTLAPALTWALTELVANPAARLPAAATALLAFLALAAVVATLRTLPRPA